MQYVHKMKVKCFDIEAGKLIAIIHEHDAKELGILPLDRVEITNPKTGKSVVTVADTTNSMVQPGQIGLFRDVSVALDGMQDHCVLDELEVKVVPTPESVAFIKKKMDGQKLSDAELRAIVADIASNKLSEIEAAAFVSSVYIRGFDLEETVSMTKALVGNGKRMHLKAGPILDKHSIGGLNGRATMVIVPIVAAAGFFVPKTSSRSITSAAGTADAMEVLTNVNLTTEEIRRITEEVGAVIAWGGAVDLAPADDKIIKIEHPLSLDPEGQVIASVLAKKVSVGSEYVVIDLPIGPEVKIKTKERGVEMAKKFVEVGKRVGITVESVLTDGTEPSGLAFGPALEAKYVLEILEGKFFDNLARKSCELAGIMFELVGRTKDGEGYKLAREILDSGKALAKMKQIVLAQGGGKGITASKDVPKATFVEEIKSDKEGEIESINVRSLIAVARLAGTPSDKTAGVLLRVTKESKVRKGDCLFEIHAENRQKLELAVKVAKTSPLIEMERSVIQKFE